VSDELSALAREIALEVGALQRERFHDERTIDTKSTPIDLVTDVDHASERIIVERIAAARPDDGILTEETGLARTSSSGVCWIIDPLDGTTNYAHRMPHFAVSIGVEVDGVREVGVIYDPIRQELFSAQRGKGGSVNGRPLRVSRATQLDQALLATGFAYDRQRAAENVEFFTRFLGRARAVRRAGSAALDLAYVAAGRFDGFWEMHLHAWDVAAGYLMVEEAGGRVSDFDGGPAPSSGERCVASNGALHGILLAVLA